MAEILRLHTFKNTVPRKARKRVGRGHGNNWGRTSGRGEKGQKARSGAVRRLHFEGGQIPLFRRLPKKGFNNPNHKAYVLVNVQYLEENFEAGAVVDASSLKRKVGDKLGAGIKILGVGELTKSLTVKATKFSTTAKSKIESAGGTCELTT